MALVIQITRILIMFSSKFRLSSCLLVSPGMKVMNRPARKYPLTLPLLETHMAYRPTPITEIKLSVCILHVMPI